jgi:hypothetical protein
MLSAEAESDFQFHFSGYENETGYMTTSSVCLNPEGSRKCHDVLS